MIKRLLLQIFISTIVSTSMTFGFITMYSNGINEKLQRESESVSRLSDKLDELTVQMLDTQEQLDELNYQIKLANDRLDKLERW